MKSKNTICLTENQFKVMISEAIRNVINELHSNQSLLKEYNTYSKTDIISVDLADVEFSKNLDEFFLESPYETMPDKVDVEVTFQEIPYDGGDYYNEPSGGYLEYEGCSVDYYDEYKKLLPPDLYNVFLEDVESYVECNWEKIAETIDTDDYPYDRDYDERDNVSYN